MTDRPLLRAHLHVVSPVHVRILKAVAEAEREYGSLDLRLEGGTALSAYYLMHRQSEDLDLFGSPGMDARDFRIFVEGHLLRKGLHVVSHGPANQGFAEFLVSDQPAAVPASERQNVQVQFGRSSPFHLDPPVPTREEMPVASFRDVCAGKLHALCDRYEPRDFIDLHCILHDHRPGEAAPDEPEQRRRFRALVADLEASDPGLSEVQVGQALARGVERRIVTEFPLRLLVPLEDAEVQRTVQVCIEECASLAREKAVWHQAPNEEPAEEKGPSEEPGSTG
ncbi:MAG: hypothetical protein EA350_14040 [Gemmatimonadales bacterium]|nr:MAG: hypothetical protein EA350_14040 [Gemmatimonadales bacterium]